MGTSIFNGNFFLFEHGKNSAFRTVIEKDKMYLEKYFNYETEEERTEKIKTIDEVLKLQYSGFSLLPEEFTYQEEIACGYKTLYLENSYNFEEKESFALPYPLRLHACSDTASLLHFLHMNGFIFNDIKLTNHVISATGGDASLVDFEDMILKKDYKVKPTSYRFFDPYTYKMKKPSLHEDVKKQFICHLSLLLQENFEAFVISSNEWQLLEKLKVDKEIYEIANILFHDEGLIYFQDIGELFIDQERIANLSRKLKDN